MRCLAEPSNMYLPPPTPSTETPIVIHPPDDPESVYLPPFHEEIPPPETEPPQNYLPPETVSYFSLLCYSKPIN